MNTTDILLIESLSQDSRTSLKDLAKKTHLSEEGISNRLNKLIESHTITPYTIINYFNIGNKNIHIQIKFEKLLQADLIQIIERLTKIANIGWISETFHKYDVVISIIYKDFKVIEDVIENLKGISKNKIKKINFLNIKEAYYLSYFPQDKFDVRKVVKIKHDLLKEIVLRPKEHELVKLISKNGRYKLTELGSHLNMSPNAVKYLIKELKQKKVILDHGIYMNYLNIGFKWYKIVVETYAEESLLKKILSLKGVTFVCRTLEEKIIIDFIAKETIDVRDFVTKIEKIFKTINDYEIYEIIKTHKVDNTNKS
jgi:DNA-binding Lrp family transcriptional regulator